MSNLSDLLPAGAAAKQLTFTDSGSGIATKKPVILNSDGTVTEVGNASASFGSAQAFATGNYGSPASAYDPDNDRVCTVYICLLYTSPSPRDLSTSRMPSSA